MTKANDMMRTSENHAIGNWCASLAPQAEAGARVLILGSMPGTESLARQQYYAFRGNAFWPVMGELLGFDPALPYDERLAALRRGGVALWDVLQGCRRHGSLDGAIRQPVPNPLPELLQACPEVRLTACNGTAAARYLRRFFPALAETAVLLPSSSPAAARLSAAAKLALWRQALQPALRN